jgi:endonuclease/exonuclease/phosphatase family metal-dependent hydrolase
MKVAMTYIICLISIVASAQEITFVSWNLRDFGQSRDDNEINLIAKELRHADIVAIQEVVAKHPGGAQAVARLADELSRMGENWDYVISDPTGGISPHKRERYAFLWKKSIVNINRETDRLLSELDEEVVREPYIAEFNIKGHKLTILNYHACTHTKAYPERLEISAISDWLSSQAYDNVIWAGDMNLVIDDIAFNSILNTGYTSALHGEKTSLKTKCKEGNYLSRAEDNVIYRLNTLHHKQSMVLDFIAKGNCSDVSWKRTSYSDHMPVLLNLGIQ